jgi:ABC-type uncharacterized transport system YnjBCD permease subunit
MATFLANHASRIIAADLFSVFQRLLVLIILRSHDRRRIVHLAVTAAHTSVADNLLTIGSGRRWTLVVLIYQFPQQKSEQWQSAVASCHAPGLS